MCVGVCGGLEGAVSCAAVELSLRKFNMDDVVCVGGWRGSCLMV